MSSDVYKFLDDNQIEYKIHSHQPVYTVEQAKKLRSDIQGMHSKNLFIKDSKKKRYYLLTTPADKKIDLKDISKVVYAKKLSLANQDALKLYLGVDPGAVSPLGLINDNENKVEYLLDSEVWEASIVNFHPNNNSKSLEFSNSNFRKLVPLLNKNYKIVQI
ncbi:MAG: prolyl-tRNA synthetase associated domain-containing protein [Candidatus Hodarchaeales archaeon]|jgi:Ala-tRNA(Pro) deacylase